MEHMHYHTPSGAPFAHVRAELERIGLSPHPLNQQALHESLVRNQVSELASRIQSESGFVLHNFRMNIVYDKLKIDAVVNHVPEILTTARKLTLTRYMKTDAMIDGFDGNTIYPEAYDLSDSPQVSAFSRHFVELECVRLVEQFDATTQGRIMNREYNTLAPSASSPSPFSDFRGDVKSVIVALQMLHYRIGECLHAIDPTLSHLSQDELLSEHPLTPRQSSSQGSPAHAESCCSTTALWWAHAPSLLRQLHDAAVNADDNTAPGQSCTPAPAQPRATARARHRAALVTSYMALPPPSYLARAVLAAETATASAEAACAALEEQSVEPPSPQANTPTVVDVYTPACIQPPSAAPEDTPRATAHADGTLPLLAALAAALLRAWRVCDPGASAGSHNLWIAKPGALSRGRGIHLLRSLAAAQPLAHHHIPVPVPASASAAATAPDGKDSGPLSPSSPNTTSAIDARPSLRSRVSARAAVARKPAGVAAAEAARDVGEAVVHGAACLGVADCACRCLQREWTWAPPQSVPASDRAAAAQDAARTSDNASNDVVEPVTAAGAESQPADADAEVGAAGVAEDDAPVTQERDKQLQQVAARRARGAAALSKAGVDRMWLVQRYLARPLLLRGYKFDLRQWLLLTIEHPLVPAAASTDASCDSTDSLHSLAFKPDRSRVRLSCWLFDAPYARLSSAPFTLDSDAPAAHITNNSVQKHEQQFGRLAWARGNMLGARELARLLDEQTLAADEQTLAADADATPTEACRSAGSRSGLSGADARATANGAATPGLYERVLLPALVERSKYIFASFLRDYSEHVPRARSFELLGVDWACDADGLPWLLEVNISPTFADIHVPGILRRVSADMVRVTTRALAATTHAAAPASAPPLVLGLLRGSDPELLASAWGCAEDAAPASGAVSGEAVEAAGDRCVRDIQSPLQRMLQSRPLPPALWGTTGDRMGSLHCIAHADASTAQVRGAKAMALVVVGRGVGQASDVMPEMTAVDNK